MQLTRWQIKTACLVAVLFLLAGTSSAQDEISGLSVTLTRLEQSLPAPDFILKDMDDEPHALQDYRGKVVLINFWATWCPPCRKEMPSLERLYQKFSEQPFVVLAVNQWEDADHVFTYMGDLNVFPSFPILFDPDSTVSADYGVRGLPTSFIIDPEGKIIYKAVGGREFDHPAIVQLIRALFEK